MDSFILNVMRDRSKIRQYAERSLIMSQLCDLLLVANTLVFIFESKANEATFNGNI